MKRKVPVILSMLLAAGIASPALTVNAAPSFNPYKTIQAEAKFGDSGVEITTEESGAKVVSSIDKGDYFFVKDVNFSEGLSKITISAKTAGPAVIEVRKGGADGDVLGNIKLSSTNGEYKDFSASMKNVEGKDTIAFVGAAGTVSIDYWTAEAAQATETQPENPQPENPQPENPQPENPQPEQPTTSVDAYSTVEAESAQDKYFAADLSKDGVNYLGIKANGYIVFKDVDLSKGISGLMINAKSDRPNTSLELHVDSVDSAAIAAVKVKSPAAFSVCAEKFTSDVTGKHDVYLVAKTGTVNLDSWNLLPATNVTPDPVNPDPVTPDPVNPDPVTPDPVTPDPVTPVVTDPYSDFQAEAANVKEAATDATAGDATYTSIKANGYIAFKDVDLTKGISGVMLNAKSAAPNTTVDVRVDGVDGQSLGSVKIMSMGAFKNAAVKIDSTLTGKHDLYLVVTNGVADIDSLKLLPGKITPDPVNPDPVNPDPVNPDPVNPDPVNPDPVNPDPVNPDPVVTEGLNVRYEINSWGTGYVVNFYVDNQSGSTTNGWTVKVRKDQVSIDNSWCVNIREEGDYYVITPLDWNKNIANGQSIQFGIIGSGSIGNTLDVTVQ
ncbi:MAG: carbohydrate-binding protein [Pseudobutyrivibrio sp.]|nr:carbohydrate-binding protein [Pseudobutyrivibrio sp.]